MPENTERISKRFDSVDFLRGLVMVVMLIDHTREYVHAGALLYSPTDLSKTNVAVFMTRWITHLCAPTFVLLAGTSIYLQKLRGRTPEQLSKFLLTRGLWLIVLEFTVVRFSLFFNFDYTFFGLAEVIWVFGVSMIVLAGLVFLPVRLVGVLGVAMIALHNVLDAVVVPGATSMASTPPPDVMQALWLFLHQPGFVPLLGGAKMFVAYPLIPWVGVMAVGYALVGVAYSWEAVRRRKYFAGLGLGLTILFLALRGLNVYGDPQPWSVQSDPLYTVLSFLNTTKYPASLLFLLMTLGPALLILAFADRFNDRHRVNPLWGAFVVFGRVPLFYFVLQMFVAHGFGLLLSAAAGKDIAYMFFNFPASTTEAPAGSGFDLWVVYACWLAGLVVLYPVCVWYGNLKKRRPGFPLNYL